jgi:hypothetical protein
MVQRQEGVHQHARSGKSYAYVVAYEARDGDIDWRAEAEREGRRCWADSGTIAMGSPAAEALAEKAVIDVVIKAIDALDDSTALGAA